MNMAEVATSQEMKEYFKKLDDDTEVLYQIAQKARKRGTWSCGYSEKPERTKGIPAL